MLTRKLFVDVTATSTPDSAMSGRSRAKTILFNMDELLGD
jgi:hypothetical protein